MNPYPDQPPERDRWILARRPARSPVDPWRPSAFLLEEERAESGEIVSTVTIFLTNRECPWRCLMCDLWKHTLTETVPLGAIPAQIDYALGRMAGSDRARPGQIKLYNAGSFFDPRAIPVADYPAIAERVRGFERVIVECHPALVNERVLQFRALLPGRLEVALGLETAHPDVLAKLNKRMTLDQFRQAAEFLRRHGVGLRVFVLVKPPFLDEAEALDWAERSIDFAFDCGATVVSLIPTRFGNGALEGLAAQGLFSPPRLATLESALAYGIRLQRGRVFADLWDLEKFSSCAVCFPARQQRLQQMNLDQTTPQPLNCAVCGGT
ncbi:MAG: radical SAM protein [Verrucomicrobia bacterium]|nr:radical SAM protein [Verrucomicrobiota bacterium]